MRPLAASRGPRPGLQALPEARVAPSQPPGCCATARILTRQQGRAPRSRAAPRAGKASSRCRDFRCPASGARYSRWIDRTRRARKIAAPLRLRQGYGGPPKPGAKAVVAFRSFGRRPAPKARSRRIPPLLARRRVAGSRVDPATASPRTGGVSRGRNWQPARRSSMNKGGRITAASREPRAAGREPDGHLLKAHGSGTMPAGRRARALWRSGLGNSGREPRRST
jgi:hypothetical protein